MMTQGTIYLVGTGPGDTGLITVKGLALIREADAVVCHAEVHPLLLREARPNAEIHDVGCLRSRAKISQEQVNQLLLKLAGEGKTVVRLWPGDPFVFGRAAQEMAEALRHGVRVELVPGVTSAIAAPAYAGVPVIHWEYASSFAVVSGSASKNSAVRPDWEALARIETLVILMPLDNLSDIVEQLLAAGRSANSPALAVQYGSLPQQKQVQSTLGGLVEAVKTHPVGHLTTVVIGAVAGLANKLNWFKAGDYPLLGKRVLVTRPAHQTTDFMASLREMGAEPVLFPTIEIKPVENNHILDEAIWQLDFCDWLVITSVNGVNAFWKRLDYLGLDSRCLASVRIAAIGPATGAALRQRSIIPDLIPDVYTAEGVLATFDLLEDSVEGQHFLLPRADIARKTLAEELVKRGAVVDEIASYRTVPVQNNGTPPYADIVTFTSSSTVQGYVNCLGEQSPAEALKNSRVVCIGPITAATAKKLSISVDAVADKYTIKGMLEKLKEIKR